LDSSVSAVLPVCKASAEFSRKPAVELPDVLVDDVLEDELEELEEVSELEELDVVDAPDVVDEPAEGAVGWKKVLPVANPTFAAFVPPMLIVAVSFSPLTTSWPLLFSHAATCALP